MEISGIKGANEAIQHNHYCYDQRDYIGDAVKSAISQGDQLKEVIVVDDASSDGSPEVLSQYAEAIQVIEFPRNRGAPEVRNRGAASAQGEYLVFLDGDDVLLPWALDVSDRIVSERKPKVVLGRLTWFEGPIPSVVDMDVPEHRICRLRGTHTKGSTVPG